MREAAAACAEHGVVLTARCENLLYKAGDLDDTIARLVAYREAGAEVLYPPGLVEAADITRVVTEVGAPVNVLAFPGAPPIDQLADARRAPGVDRRRAADQRLPGHAPRRRGAAGPATRLTPGPSRRRG